MFYALNTITVHCAGNKEIKTIIKRPSLQKSMPNICSANIIKGFVQIERKEISGNNNNGVLSTSFRKTTKSIYMQCTQ